MLSTRSCRVGRLLPRPHHDRIAALIWGVGWTPREKRVRCAHRQHPTMVGADGEGYYVLLPAIFEEEPRCLRTSITIHLITIFSGRTF